MKYKCPECKKKDMKKQVYTEEFCKCGHVNHTPHTNRRIREELKKEQEDER